MTLYLSQLSLNLRNRNARTALGDLYETHRLVCSAFGDLGPDPAGRLLWRWEPSPDSEPRLLVQSAQAPRWNELGDELLSREPVTKDISALRSTLRAGSQYRFALVANPTRKIDTKSGPDGKRRHGRRVPLQRPDDQIAWITRKAIDSGFAVPDNQLGAPTVTPHASALHTGQRKGRTITVEHVRFEGVLSVTDPERLFTALSQGIGPARSFGCGLLTLAPLR